MKELRDDELEQVNGGGMLDSIMEGYMLTWDAKFSYLDPVVVLNQADLGVGYVQDLPDEKLKIYVVFFPDAKGGEKSMRIHESLLRKA